MLQDYLVNLVTKGNTFMTKEKLVDQIEGLGDQREYLGDQKGKILMTKEKTSVTKGRSRQRETDGKTLVT